MKDNTIVLTVGATGLVALGIAGLFTGHPEISLLAAGALAGLVGGHLNGTNGGASNAANKA